MHAIHDVLSSTERLATPEVGLGDAWPEAELLEDAVAEDDMDEDIDEDVVDEDVMDGVVFAVEISVVVVTLELLEVEVVMIGPPGLILSEVVLVAIVPSHWGSPITSTHAAPVGQHPVPPGQACKVSGHTSSSPRGCKFPGTRAARGKKSALENWWNRQLAKARSTGRYMMVCWWNKKDQYSLGRGKWLRIYPQYSVKYKFGEGSVK
ncbi:hypothetical protein N7474_003617 [Penicillium riverlandense]|uniref:uncharacterized protein n=1 Tax=Penicillium riverlandense TaxID=1903569 RepID=UPI0025479301|nr:uncharacterized protein N7474_003617 [Penicillium riverlandense]KAJ5818026.1 hypothetical protein N7474_003617 [Penicillium riverlandense]